MSWLSSFFHPEHGYEAAQNELNNYWGQAKEFQQPFINNAKGAYSGLSEALQKLLNPAALQDEWSQGYKESDYAKNLEGELMDRGLGAAQSMGLGGSSSALQALQGGTQKIVGQERQQYLNDIFQKYLHGVGLGQGIYGAGANASGNLSNLAGQMGRDSAELKFGEENAPGDMFSKLLEGITSFVTPIGQSWGMKKLGLNNKSPWSTTGRYSQ